MWVILQEKNLSDDGHLSQMRVSSIYMTTRQGPTVTLVNVSCSLPTLTDGSSRGMDYGENHMNDRING